MDAAHAALQDGRLPEAIAALGQALRERPTDVRARTFLFELLCLAGEYERAVRQLDILGKESPEAELGGLLYKGAIRAQREREALFHDGAFPTAPAPAVSGTLNGQRFTTLEDADPRIGARIECFAAGQYMWLPLAHVSTLTMPAPRTLRDTFWPTASVRTAESFRGLELGEVILPVIAVGTTAQADPLLHLGRMTIWTPLPDGGEAPLGLKYWLVDGEEFPLLEMRSLDIDPQDVT